MLRRLGLSLLLVFAVSCARPGPKAERVLVPVLTRLEIELAAGESTELRARPLAAHVRPELRVWDPAARREVARAGPPWLEGDSVLRLAAGGGGMRRYQLLVFASAPGRSGPVALSRDGRLLAPHVEAGGLELTLATDAVAEYQAAAAPGGLRRALLLGLDRDGALLALDEHSGPTGLPKLPAAPGIARLIVGSLEPHAGRISVYANDREDRDGDGVGRRLERALGSCDAPGDRGCRSSALRDFYVRVRGGTRDTDRDGLSDADELFGVDASALDLPRYGVNVRHKDVLVEIDHQAKLADVGFQEHELEQVAKLFAQGSASDLRNPDGRPGVALHFDAGFVPRDPAHGALLGDFGGSGASKASDYRSARRADFTPARAGYFRYVFSTRSGRGQATGDALTVNRDLARVSILAHELGHTLGLAHHGHDRWGKANCKPAYYSIMNYLYQARVELGFSRRAAPRQSPARVLERAAAPRGMGPLLADTPLELDVRGRDVDWNRDGVISDEPVRAGLTWGTFKSCGAGEHGSVQLAHAQVARATPVLLRSAQRLLALWLDEPGALWLRSEAQGGEWGGPQRLAAGELPLRAIAAVALDAGGLVLASVDDQGGLALQRLDPGDSEIRRASSASALTRAGARTLSPDPAEHTSPPERAGPSESARPAPAARSQSGARAPAEPLRAAGFGLALGLTASLPGATPLAATLSTLGRGSQRRWGAPALAWGPLDARHYGAERALFMIAADAETGALAQWVMQPDSGRSVQRAVLDTRGEPVLTGLPPSLLALPTGELCGVFADVGRQIRIYVYRPEQDAWQDLSASAFDAALGPRSAGPVGMAFHLFRAASGAPLRSDASRGALYLTFTEPESAAARSPDNPHVYVSEWLDARHPARQQLHMRWRGRVITEWTNLAAGTGAALYEDELSEALSALLFVQARDGYELDFLPYADGSHDADLGSGSDFQVMERGICSVLRGDAACGDASTGAY